MVRVQYLSPHFLGDTLGLHVSLQLGHDQDDHKQDLSRKNEDVQIGKLLVTGFKFSGTCSPILDRLRDRWQECHCWNKRQGGVKQVTEVVNGPTLFAGYEAFEREFHEVSLRCTQANSRWKRSQKRWWILLRP